MSVDVLIIRPKTKAICADPPPLGLGYLAAHLKKSGLSVKIVDLRKPGAKSSELIETLKSDQPKVAGVQVYSRDAREVSELIGVVDEISGRSCQLVAGGPHVGTFDEKTLEHFPRFDYAIAGEGELSFPLLVKMILGDASIKPGGIAGLIYRKDGGFVVNPRHYVENIDELGFPDRDLLDVKSYRAETFGGGFVKYTPATTMLASRSCPFNCAFCCVKSIMGTRQRSHSAEHVIEELSILERQYGFREVKLVDDSFGLNKDFVLNLAQAYREKGLKIALSFACGLHLAAIDDDVLEAFKQMGVYEILIAIESGSDKILKTMRKGITLSLVHGKVDMIKKHGFPIVAFFMLGYPGETREDINSTLKLSLKLPIQRVHFNTFFPLPGSEIYRDLQATGKLGDYKLEQTHFETFRNSFVDGLSAKQLNQIRRKALLRFYLRPRIMGKILFGIRSWTTYKFLASKAIEYFGLTNIRKANS